MYIALLGRQPELSIAELERVFTKVKWHGPNSALIDTDQPIDIQRLGGTQKLGRVVIESEHPRPDWRRVSEAIVRYYSQQWSQYDGKITLGISVYDWDISVRDIQKIGLILKSKLKQSGTSLRLIPNQEAALSSATSHHNKLGLSGNKVELMIVRGRSGVIVAESSGAQNITALATRDQGRPKRDAFVGMLPPKLALMMVNMATGTIDKPTSDSSRLRVLDPFCGTGVLLQEAALLGHAVYGTDLSEKMIRYSEENLAWLEKTHRLAIDYQLHEGDAMDTKWKQPINAIASEAYLGQPFSAPPSPSKLTEVRGNCNHIIGSFLKNLSAQLQPGTAITLAVPAWKDKNDLFTHLPLTGKLADYGFERINLETVDSRELMYFRPDQVVARELLLIVKK